MNPHQKIRIRIDFKADIDPRSLETKNGATYAEILKERHINPQSVLVFVDGVPRPNDDRALDGELMEVIPVCSRG